MRSLLRCLRLSMLPFAVRTAGMQCAPLRLHIFFLLDRYATSSSSSRFPFIAMATPRHVRPSFVRQKVNNKMTDAKNYDWESRSLAATFAGSTDFLLVSAISIGRRYMDSDGPVSRVYQSIYVCGLHAWRGCWMSCFSLSTFSLSIAVCNLRNFHPNCITRRCAWCDTTIRAITSPVVTWSESLSPVRWYTNECSDIRNDDGFSAKWFFGGAPSRLFVLVWHSTILARTT